MGYDSSSMRLPIPDDEPARTLPAPRSKLDAAYQDTFQASPPRQLPRPEVAPDPEPEPSETPEDTTVHDSSEERVETAYVPPEKGNDGLPALVSASEFVRQCIPKPPEVIQGVLRRGSKMIFGGTSKSYKSWNLLDLCIAVSTGGSWLGFKCNKGGAVYVNLELQEYTVQERTQILCAALRVAPPDNLQFWHLRGDSKPLDQLIACLQDRLEDNPCDLIVIDPIYKSLRGRDENSAGDIAALCDEIQGACVRTGAAVAFAAHFAKGNASAKESIDRIAGSGVWARDPDSIITLTPHKQEGCYTCDLTLREFAPVPQFALRWAFPLMQRDDSIDPAALRTHSGRPEVHAGNELVDTLGKDSLSSKDWQKRCEEQYGMPRRTFFRLLARGYQNGLYDKNEEDKWCWNPSTKHPRN